MVRPPSDALRTPVGLRERKKQETRSTLCHAALRLALRHGVESVTVDAIARAAEVSPRTFFNYFSSKEEAIVAPTRALAVQFADALRARPAGEPLAEALDAALTEVLAGLRTVHRELLRNVRLVRENPALLPHQLAAHAVIERSLADAIAERTGIDSATDPYPRVAAAAVIAALRAATARWSERGPSRRDAAGDLLAAARYALAQVTAGIATPLAR